MSKQICQLHPDLCSKSRKHHFIEKLRMNEHVFATRARALSLSYFLFFSLFFVTLKEELRNYYSLSLPPLSRYHSYLFSLLLARARARTLSLGSDR
jgi:hypothetical protein